MATSKLYGVVVEPPSNVVGSGLAQWIYCEDAPEHLKHHHMVGMVRAKGAKPGDRVVLEYKTSASFGLWFAKLVDETP